MWRREGKWWIVNTPHQSKAGHKPYGGPYNATHTPKPPLSIDHYNNVVSPFQTSRYFVDSHHSRSKVTISSHLQRGRLCRRLLSSGLATNIGNIVITLPSKKLTQKSLISHPTNTKIIRFGHNYIGYWYQHHPFSQRANKWRFNWKSHYQHKWVIVRAFVLKHTERTVVE